MLRSNSYTCISKPGRWSFLMAFALCFSLLAGVWAPLYEVWAGRYEDFTKKAEGGEKMKVVAATYFGSAGYEEFLAAGGLDNDQIVAMGNAWGPDFPAHYTTVVLGKGTHQKLNPMGQDDKKRPFLRSDDPDMAGMLVFYEPGLKRVKKVVRFDWGVASLSAGLVDNGGNTIFIAGRATEAFRALASHAEHFETQPNPAGKAAGEYTYEKVKCPGDIYIARMDPETNKFQWVWVLEGFKEAPERLFTDRTGAVYFYSQGFHKITSDGSSLKKINEAKPTKTMKYLAVDPNDGSHYFGGDRNTNTGHEPWRQPFLYKFDAEGKKLWKLWEWDPKKCGSGAGQNHLESDSSPRAVEVDADGNLIVSGWSDGGNSVFTKMANNVEKPAPSKGFGIAPWGMKNANSLGHLMKINPATQETLNHQWYSCFIPDTFTEKRVRGAPNHASLDELRLLVDGSMAFTGKAATGLISTPNSFYKYPNDGNKYGGPFVTVLSKDSSTMLFSSYLPGLENVNLGTTPEGLLIASRSHGNDAQTPTTNSPITPNAVQKQCAGNTDAHLILLELPKSSTKPAPVEPPKQVEKPAEKPPEKPPEKPLETTVIEKPPEIKTTELRPEIKHEPKKDEPLSAAREAELSALPPAIIIPEQVKPDGLNWPYIIAGVGLLVAAAILGVKMFGEKPTVVQSHHRRER